MSDTGFRIVPAERDDREWLLPLSARLHDFGPPDYRPREQMDRAVAASIEAALLAPEDGQVVLVARDLDDTPLGFVHLHPAQDFFTAETHGHVSDIVVAPGAEGRGVGTALMAAAEDWARSRGYRLLTLNVFGENRRARAMYDRLGYRADTTKMVKVLLALLVLAACTGGEPREDNVALDTARVDTAPAATQDSASYRIVSPAAGAEWREGGTYVIRWSGAGAGAVNVSAAVGGKDKGHLAMALPAGTDTLVWTVPDGFVTGFGPASSDEVRIRVESAEDPRVGAESPPFTISGR